MPVLHLLQSSQSRPLQCTEMLFPDIFETQYSNRNVILNIKKDTTAINKQILYALISDKFANPPDIICTVPVNATTNAANIPKIVILWA